MAEYVNESAAKAAVGSTMGEAIAGIGAVALSILGLANVIPGLLVTIATIAVGVALAFEGGAIAGRYRALIAVPGTREDKSAEYGGTTAQFLAGAAGIALGILALLGVVPQILVSIAAIVFGSALILDSGANTRLAQLEASRSTEFSMSHHAVAESAKANASVQVLVGVGAIALGILALIGIAPLTLDLVAMLSIGAVNLLTGTIMGGRLASVFR